jgi:hypothetical protein
MIKYTEYNSQDSPDKYVFYTYKEFFKFWEKNYKNGIINLISHSEMEDK